MEREPNNSRSEKPTWAEELADEIVALREKRDKGEPVEEELLSKIEELEEIYDPKKQQEREAFLEAHKFKTIKIGTFDASGLKAALRGFPTATPGGDFWEKIRVAPAMEDVDLFIVSSLEMNLSDKPSSEEIYRQAKRLGLEACSAEVGIQLRLQYDKQPLRDSVTVVTSEASVDDILLFSTVYCNHQGTPGLAIIHRPPTDFASGPVKLIFKRREF